MPRSVRCVCALVTSEGVRGRGRVRERVRGGEEKGLALAESHGLYKVRGGRMVTSE